MTAAEPMDNRLFILILQHPRENREPLATAGLTCAALRHAALVSGLSWPNLGRALGRSVDPKHWAVLYLGSARPAAYALRQEVIALDRRGEPAADQEAMLRGLDGVVLLDGSWSEAKTLWWRNPWLLKLRRIVQAPSDEGPPPSRSAPPRCRTVFLQASSLTPSCYAVHGLLSNLRVKSSPAPNTPPRGTDEFRPRPWSYT